MFILALLYDRRQTHIQSLFYFKKETFNKKCIWKERLAAQRYFFTNLGKDRIDLPTVF